MLVTSRGRWGLPFSRLLQMILLILLALGVGLLPLQRVLASGDPYDTYCIDGGDCAFYDPTECPVSADAASASTGAGVTVDNQAGQKAAQQASSGNTKVGYALYDSTGKKLASYNDTSENYGASITKSMLLVAYLKQIGSGSLSSEAKNELTNMIENSDNPAANWVYSHLTNGSSAVNGVASAAGMSGFQLNNSSDPVYVLGQSKITANDFAQFFSKIDTLFPPEQKDFALNLLSHLSAADQNGLLQAGLPGTVYSKEGWKSESVGLEGAPYIVNQAAQFSSNGTTYGVAVTVGGTSDRDSGETIVKAVVSALISGGQPAPTASTSTSCCAGSGTENIPAGTLPSFIPEPYNGAFTQGANNHNVAPALLAALFSEENNLGNNGTNPDTSILAKTWADFAKQHPNPNSGWGTSSKGAQGPFQFEPSTWTSLGYDLSKINDLVTSADAAAKYAQTDGATKNTPESSWKTFIFSYNHADWYVTAVLKYYDYYNSQPGATPGGASDTIITGPSSDGSTCSSTSNGSIVQNAINLSWPDESHGTTPNAAYAAALRQYNDSGYSQTGGLGDDCGVFVATVMHASGADPNYPDSYTVAQAQYVIDHPDKYQVIYPATSTSQLQPGDILILNQGTTKSPDGTINVGQGGGGAGGHTFIYLGSQGSNGYNEASASLGSRSAGLGTAQLNDSRGQYLIARLK